ncbi:PAS domain-containing protein [Flavobacterium chilense]|uniref:PAS domain S-box-containing protein n=1 Tax=Flavobacterium chilense TaxID=946677 RepID=A0A1M7D3Y6_9FLAO|nr:PAS domain-containing protein [Flavobacterium chilense]SHL74165.1 PAS domain S-box-containing protein [Flavobacterium chilense]
MKTNKSDEISNRNSVPILAWDFHCEYVRELKAALTDLKKVKKISNQFTWNEKNLAIEERLKNEVVLVTDLDLKIVFASNGIKRMTGYAEEEILGKTPKMFQGPATSKTVLKEIREAIKLQVPFEKTIENYRKDGRTYQCKITSSPVFNLKGQITHFIAFERDLSA